MFSHQIWRVATARNAEQCALKLSTSPDVYTHYLVMIREMCRENCFYLNR